MRSNPLPDDTFTFKLIKCLLFAERFAAPDQVKLSSVYCIKETTTKNWDTKFPAGLVNFVLFFENKVERVEKESHVVVVVMLMLVLVVIKLEVVAYKLKLTL